MARLNPFPFDQCFETKISMGILTAVLDDESQDAERILRISSD